MSVFEDFNNCVEDYVEWKIEFLIHEKQPFSIRSIILDIPIRD